MVSVALLLGSWSASHAGKIVTAEGYSSIRSGKISLARKAAIENALFQAVTSVDAKISGYSMVVNGALRKEKTLISPGSSIINYKILEENVIDEKLYVKIKANLSDNVKLKKCKRPPKLAIRVLRPAIHISGQVSRKYKNLIISSLDAAIKKIGDHPRVQRVYVSRLTEFRESSYSNPPNLDYNSVIYPAINDAPSDFTLKFSLNGRLADHFIKNNIVVDFSLEVFSDSSNQKIFSNTETISYSSDYFTPYRSLNIFLNDVSALTISGLYQSEFIRKMDLTWIPDAKCGSLKSVLRLVGNNLVANLGSRHGVRIADIGIVENKQGKWQPIFIKTVRESQTVFEMPIDGSPSEMIGQSVKIAEANERE
tara:strand:- start:2149 stop:3249 length:1101 start_codon:yes stop_codon:yes gene_type:complete